MIISGTAASANGGRNTNREIRVICFCFQTKRRERRRTPTGDEGMMSVGKESGRRPGRCGGGRCREIEPAHRLCVCTSRTCRSSRTIPLRLYPACSGFPFLIRGLWVISLKEGESLFSSLSFQIKSSLVSQTELSVNTDKTRNGSGRGAQRGLCLLRSSTA